MRNCFQLCWRITILLVICSACIRSSAQDLREIRGTVFDNGSHAVLQGVSVLNQGNNKGVSTDGKGKYTIQAKKGDVIEFSIIGYTSQEITVKDQTVIEVLLEKGGAKLDQVVVIGYGTVKKSDVTGAVGSVSSKDLTAFPVTDAIMGLQGKTAGVQVSQNSGAPGGSVSVRIRGGNSLLGNNEPLYVVDGFALAGDPDAINPNDIESIEILKDASSTAIYGSRGANGVVLITTKKGKAGRSQVTFDSYYAVQKVSKRLDLMNAKQFAELANERAQNDGFAPYFTASQVNSFQQGTNWQDAIFQTAPMKNNSINFSGGNENTQYSISGNYLGQDGIIVGSGLNRESVRALISQKISDKIRLTYNATLTNTDLAQITNDNGTRGNSVLSGALVAPPTIAPYDGQGNYNLVTPYAFSPNILVNPLAQALAITQKTNQKYILAGTALTYEPIKDLIFKTSIGIENSRSKVNAYSPSIIPATPTGQASINTVDGMNILNENTVTYSKRINTDHNFTILGGITYQQDQSDYYNTGNITGFSTDQLGANSLQSGSIPGYPSSGSSKWVLFSYLGRINYSYRSKYLLTGSIRADGSSRFGEGNKRGYFPSAAFAWKAINEEFVRNLDFLSDLKFRLSWGITGSTAINPYQTLNTLSSYQTVYNNQLYIGYAPSDSGLANPNLKWETTAQSDAGVDIGFFKNRITLTFDYYIKNTSDLLANIPLPYTSGYSSTVANIGKIRNQGMELGINARIVDNAFKWNFIANVSRNRNKVLALAGGSDVFGTMLPLPLAVPVNLVRVGQPVGVFYGYVENGLDANGNIQYKNLDGVAGITAADRTIIGNPNPNFTYNFGSRLSYRNFDLNFDFQGSQGGDIFNATLSSIANSFSFGENQLKDVFNNHWSAANKNPNAKYPRISAATTFQASNRFVENGSYLRLRNLQLAYNVNLAKLNAKWIKSLQVYVSAQNLLTFTKYSGYDPQVSTLGGSNSISLGIDDTAYPSAKLFTAGLHLGL
ncbi:MAG TPA: TonB-dependent receptor [Puia sp.]|jgi:TonB-linked SusC/RagA family outer membrane protein|nr:TonB-dependent receptor [Puia sp.]